MDSSLKTHNLSYEVELWAWLNDFQANKGLIDEEVLALEENKQLCLVCIL